MIRRPGSAYTIVAVPGVRELNELASNRITFAIASYREAGRYRGGSRFLLFDIAFASLSAGCPARSFFPGLSEI